MSDLAVTGNVQSAVTDPHRRKDFLDPTEMKAFLEAAKSGRQGARDHLLITTRIPAMHTRVGTEFQVPARSPSFCASKLPLAAVGVIAAAPFGVIAAASCSHKRLCRSLIIGLVKRRGCNYRSNGIDSEALLDIRGT
jgi:hypothetical protein